MQLNDAQNDDAQKSSKDFGQYVGRHNQYQNKNRSSLLLFMSTLKCNRNLK